MKKKIIWISLIVLVLVVLIILGKSGSFSSKSDEITVTESAAFVTEIVEKVSAIGKVQPEVEVKISSEVSGEIIELPVREGDVVEKGILLVRVNPDIIQAGVTRTKAGFENTKAAYEQAKASLKEAKANYDRNKTLFERGVISKADWDAAVARFEVAKGAERSAYFNVQSAAATVNEASDNLTRTNIFAPIDGTITKLDAELGERVVGTQQMAGTEIMRIANLKNMQVEVDVNENDIIKIALGQDALIEVDAFPKKEFKGIVTSIANSANASTSADQVTNFKVNVSILPESYKELTEGKPEGYSPLRPGMTASVSIITKRAKDALAVPISAIVVKNDTTSQKSYKIVTRQEIETAEQKFEGVFVNENGTAQFKLVKTGIQDDRNIVIDSGLTEGQKIITGPYHIINQKLV
ncbi:MAG: efflux RND transporter periplasmic adaptor subunit, partial [Flavobacteriaceae bacterium]|nr:efflux RND transporter periplasmic adaptor subunit [Flavobacteriaceae bacterium]